jgi:hypothetical protein
MTKYGRLLALTAGATMAATGALAQTPKADNRPVQAIIIEQLHKPGVMKDEPGCVREYAKKGKQIPMVGPDGEKTFISIRPSRCKGDTTIKLDR